MSSDLIPGDEFFEGVIRRVWHNGRWFFSVLDVLGAIGTTTVPRAYWPVLKARLREEGADQLLTNCLQLRMPAKDGKLRLTDAADEATLLRILQSAPSPKVEPVRQWLCRRRLHRLRAGAEQRSRHSAAPTG